MVLHCRSYVSVVTCGGCVSCTDRLRWDDNRGLISEVLLGIAGNDASSMLVADGGGASRGNEPLLERPRKEAPDSIPQEPIGEDYQKVAVVEEAEEGPSLRRPLVSFGHLIAAFTLFLPFT